MPRWGGQSLENMLERKEKIGRPASLGILASTGRLAVLTAGLWAATGGLASAQSDPLVLAHEQYNAQQYDAAIQSATEARQIAASADAAAVVLSRAHLERYRQMLDPDELAAARDALTAVDKGKLSARDRLDWTIGMGELLYFDWRFSTAAEFFDVALGQLDMLEPGARDRLMEWWAEALDQQAQLGQKMDRRSIYERILARAEETLRRDDRSTVATYWLAAAAAGADDFDRAWGAASAGWLRATAGPDGVKLRDDLDRLVTTVIIPQRAGHISPTDPDSAIVLLREQWEEMKRRYGQGRPTA